MEESERVTLTLKRGDKTITQMEIDEGQIKAVCAAGLGLAAPRNRKPKAEKPAPTKGSKKEPPF